LCVLTCDINWFIDHCKISLQKRMICHLDIVVPVCVSEVSCLSIKLLKLGLFSQGKILQTPKNAHFNNFGSDIVFDFDNVQCRQRPTSWWNIGIDYIVFMWDIQFNSIQFNSIQFKIAFIYSEIVIYMFIFYITACIWQTPYRCICQAHHY
jgi:hypothetical protein